MKNNTVANRIVWAIFAIIAMILCFLLSRYAFWELHGMKEWPFDLFLFGLIAIIIAALFNVRKIMVFIVAGYIGGFVLGMLFQTDGVDQGGARTDNAWLIWMISFVVIILIGIAFELVGRHIKKNTRI